MRKEDCEKNEEKGDCGKEVVQEGVEGMGQEVVLAVRQPERGQETMELVVIRKWKEMTGERQGHQAVMYWLKLLVGYLK